MDIVISIVGGSLGAAVVAGLFGLLQWRLNRRATKEDRAEKRTQDREDVYSMTQKVLRMLLYVEIKQHAKVHIREGSISLEDLEDLIDMHDLYHDDLGGNGFLDNVMHQVRQLPNSNCHGGDKNEKH